MASTFIWLSVVISLTCIVNTFFCAKVCDRGWTYSESDNTCLMLNRIDRKSFGDARKACQNWGGDLVTVRDEEKNEYLRSLIVGSSFMFWIGVHDEKQTRDFTHLDGSRLNFQPWSRGEPRYYRKNNAESCVMVYIPRRGKTVWQNEKCSGGRPFMCQKDVNDPKPDSNSEGSRCPNAWVYYEDDKSCLRNHRLSPDFKTFQEARTVCRENGADIVTVQDVKKDKFILRMDWSNVNVIAFWVKEEKNLVNGFNPWSPGFRVKRATGQCVLSEYIPSVYVHSKWRYRPCDKQEYFVCQKPAQ